MDTLRLAASNQPNTVTISRELLDAYEAAVGELADEFYSRLDYDLDDPTRRLIQRVDWLREQCASPEAS